MHPNLGRSYTLETILGRNQVGVTQKKGRSLRVVESGQSKNRACPIPGWARQSSGRSCPPPAQSQDRITGSVSLVTRLCSKSCFLGPRGLLLNDTKLCFHMQKATIARFCKNSSKINSSKLMLGYKTSSIRSVISDIRTEAKYIDYFSSHGTPLPRFLTTSTFNSLPAVSDTLQLTTVEN